MSIKVTLVGGDAQQQSGDVLALCVLEAPLAKQKVFVAVDEALDGELSKLAEQQEFVGKADQTIELPTLGKLPAKRLVLVGAGPRRGFDAARVRSFCAVAARCASKSESLALVLPDKVAGGPLLRAVGEGVELGAYRFDKYLTGDRRSKKTLQSVAVLKTAGRGTASEKKALELGQRVAAGVCTARDAVNEPPNVLTPAELANRAKSVARKGKLKISVLDKAGIEKAGMKLHYAVGQGSSNEPRFIHMSYVPKRAKGSIAFVGKGLTFDAGGLCIKPAPGMGEMKSDMGGAGAVLGLMQAVAAVQPNVAVHGIIGAAENMPDGNAYRPGDVFGSLDGKTVEIINTDAEGRLVLADALAYARELSPDILVDAATLTGACMVALGKTCSAFYTDNEKLAKRFDSAAGDAGESFWRMPLIAEMREQLKSDIADLKHTGDRWGGSISAALFLREFVGNCPWIHCDVAAPVLYDRAKGVYPKGGTGHPVLTFLSLIENFG